MIINNIISDLQSTYKIADVRQHEKNLINDRINKIIDSSAVNKGYIFATPKALKLLNELDLFIGISAVEVDSYDYSTYEDYTKYAVFYKNYQTEKIEGWLNTIKHLVPKYNLATR